METKGRGRPKKIIQEVKAEQLTEKAEEAKAKLLEYKTITWRRFDKNRMRGIKR